MDENNKLLNMDETLPDGSPRYRELESGAVVDRTTNKFVSRKITSDQARDMVNIRWDKYRESAASWVLKEMRSIDPSVKTEQDAWGLLVSRVASQIMDSDKPRGGDLEKLGKAIGSMPTIADVRGSIFEPRGSEEYAMLSEIAAFAARINAQVIEADAE